jgi:hypothetical protein
MNNTLTTIFAKNHGTGAVISHDLKGIGPPFDKKVMSGCETPKFKRVGRDVSRYDIVQPVACEN